MIYCLFVFLAFHTYLYDIQWTHKHFRSGYPWAVLISIPTVFVYFKSNIFIYIYMYLFFVATAFVLFQCACFCPTFCIYFCISVFLNFFLIFVYCYLNESPNNLQFKFVIFFVIFVQIFFHLLLCFYIIVSLIFLYDFSVSPLISQVFQISVVVLCDPTIIYFPSSSFVYFSSNKLHFFLINLFPV